MLALSGAKSAEVLVKFKTNASFENDWGIDDPQIKKFDKKAGSVYGQTVDKLFDV